MNYFLIKFEGNWADEFDVAGFSVLSEEEWETLQEEIQSIVYPYELGFGFNESLYFEDQEELQKCIIVRKLTNEEAYTIEKYFTNNYGLVPPQLFSTI